MALLFPCSDIKSPTIYLERSVQTKAAEPVTFANNEYSDCFNDLELKNISFMGDLLKESKEDSIELG